MTSGITCLVTLHGVGYEQPPQDGVDNSGYADPLHQHLKLYLGDRLSDDPRRQRNVPGENGAIYVESRWLDPQGRASREEGMKRLGTWNDDFQQIDTSAAPLRSGEEPFAHVALVYSNLEPTGPAPGAALMTLGMGLFSMSHYTSALDLLHLALTDAMAAFRHSAAAREPVSTLPRNDLGPRSARFAGHRVQAAPPSSVGLLAMFRDLEDDVACYVCYNEERERVRSFVREALMRLACRSDVQSLVLNTHSNGSVIAFDVLRHLPALVTRKVKAFVTAGSPLRKYVDLFHWGNQIQGLTRVEPWYNFWDRYDPVADPLAPPLSWRPGHPIQTSQERLFCRIDPQSETSLWVQVEDCEVNNVEKSRGGGLQAHNYWDNEEQVVRPLADIVCQSAGTLLHTTF
ncbi:MAG TPA: hypothetical protein VGF67_33775 [Ktedonobacteraceae bacterium]|jgi:hypothetical protein